MNVRITVTGGPYVGARYEGALRDAPVTILIPEGIVSARTVAEAASMLDAMEARLATHPRTEIHACDWAVLFEAVRP